MKESYREDLASCSGLEPYAGDGNVAGVASARGNAGQPLSSEIIPSVCRSCPDLEKATSFLPLAGEAATDTAESETLCMRRHPKRENREIPSVSESCSERSENVSDGNPDMYAVGKSDDSIVPAKRTNKTGTPAAESVEERGSPKGNADRHDLAADTAPGTARHRGVRLRLVEILYLDRCTQGRSRMR